MRISDWSSDVCSSDLSIAHLDVEQHDIGLQPGDLRDGLAATARRTRMINLGKLREDQLEPAERERLIVDGQDPYRHPAYPSGNSSVARKQEADGRPVNNFAAAPKRLDRRSRTLRRRVLVAQNQGGTEKGR